MPTHTRVSQLAAVAGAALLLTGCGNATSTGSQPTTGAAATTPDQVTSTAAPALASSVVTFTAGLPRGLRRLPVSRTPGWGSPGQLLLVTYGSSRCPKLPTAVTKTAGNGIAITTQVSTGTGPCTMDFAPTTVTLTVSQGIDDKAPVQITIDGSESTLLPR